MSTAKAHSTRFTTTIPRHCQIEILHLDAVIAADANRLDQQFLLAIGNGHFLVVTPALAPGRQRIERVQIGVIVLQVHLVKQNWHDRHPALFFTGQRRGQLDV